MYRQVCTDSPGVLLDRFARDLADVLGRATEPERAPLTRLQMTVRDAQRALKSRATPSQLPMPTPPEGVLRGRG